MTDTPARHATSAERGGSPGELLRLGAGLLQCPDHPGMLQCSVAGLRCAWCGLAIEWIAPGILGEPRPARSSLDSRAIRLMQSVMVSRIYERAWRPALIRTVSGLTYAREDALVDRYVEPRTGLAVLELCCGTGRAVRRLVGQGAQGLGIDCSIAMLREARRRCPDDRLVLLHADARRAWPQDGRFDAALCLAALHLVPDAGALLAAASASLRPGGVFLGWILTSAGRLRSDAAGALARRLGLRLVAPGALARAAALAGLQCRESFLDGSIEVVVATRAT